MESSRKMYLVGNVGSNGQIVLQFWNFVKQEWIIFQARRVKPGTYVTASGKTGEFEEKPLTQEEAKTAEEKPAETAGKYPWRDCKASRDYCQKLLDAGKDKAFIREALTAMFPLVVKVEKKSGDVFADIME